MNQEFETHEIGDSKFTVLKRYTHLRGVGSGAPFYLISIVLQAFVANLEYCILHLRHCLFIKVAKHVTIVN